MKKLNLNAIRIDGGTQSRVSLNEATVAEYAELIADGVTLPDVVVFFDGSDHWLADGFHRLHAYRKAGRASIPADVRDGMRRDAMLFSAGSNGDHGLRRTNDDKRRSVQMLLDDEDAREWSDQKIAKHCGVSVPFAGAVRRPAVAAKQQEHRKAAAPKAEPDCNPITPLSTVGEIKKAAPASAPAEDHGPTDEEIASSQKAVDDELAELRTIALADDKLAEALAAVKRLTALNRVLTERNNGLMNEKNAAIELAKKLQRRLDKMERVAA